MIGKFIILNTIGIGLLVAGWLGGLLPVLWAADKFFAFPILGVLLVLGLGMVGYAAVLANSHYYSLPKQDRVAKLNSAALELADDLPVVGLGITIISLLWGSTGVTDVDSLRTVLIHSTTGTLSGFVSYYWLRNVVRLCQ
jgi:hypothetical protein